MINLFVPKKYIKNYTYLNLEELKNEGIKMIICDIDNTLVAHDEKHPSEEASLFVEKVLAEGFDFCLISNNVSDRVEIFAKKLNVKTYPNATKPLKRTYKKILRDSHHRANEIACIGDQLLTDILGGNRMKLYTILTHPLVTRDLSYTKVNRVFENMVFKILKRKKILVKGEYDGKEM